MDTGYAFDKNDKMSSNDDAEAESARFHNLGSLTRRWKCLIVPLTASSEHTNAVKPLFYFVVCIGHSKRISLPHPRGTLLHRAGQSLSSPSAVLHSPFLALRNLKCRSASIGFPNSFFMIPTVSSGPN